MKKNMVFQKKYKKRIAWNKGLKGWNKGHVVSDNTKKKQSESTKIFWQTPEGLLKKQRMSKRTSKRLRGKTYKQLYGDRAEKIRRKIGDAQKGIPKSEEHNKKVGEAKRGKKRKPFSKEWKKKLGDATRGKTYEEIYGSRANIERIKRSESHKGEKSYLWRGGISFKPYGLAFNRNLREIIRDRDKRKCQICGKTEFKNGKKLAVHHINYNKKDNDPKNLISLCKSCHSETNHNRDYWIKWFALILKRSDEQLNQLKTSEKVRVDKI